MHTRKAMIGARSDAFIALPGGYGTFEEMFEALAWQTLKIHAKPVLLLNTNGFYDTLLAFLDECVVQGMLTQEKREIVLVARTVDEALGMLGLPSCAADCRSRTGRRCAGRSRSRCRTGGRRSI